MALNEVNNICDKSGANQKILQLFNNKCFTIVDGADSKSVFCLDDFAFPVDGSSCISIDIEMDNGEIILFDNNIELIGSPAEPLVEGKQYVRGILLKIDYPENDNNGEEIDITNKRVELYIEDSELFEYRRYPLYNLFTIFTNPKSNNASDLINKIKVVNPNDFNISITGLLIYGKVQ
jgi:hypothetical protein